MAEASAAPLQLPGLNELPFLLRGFAHTPARQSACSSTQDLLNCWPGYSPSRAGLPAPAAAAHRPERTGSPESEPMMIAAMTALATHVIEPITFQKEPAMTCAGA